MKVPAIERFMKFVFKHPNGCWIWIGSRYKFGYGSFRYKGKTHRAHKWIYEYYHGQLENSYCLHACDNSNCVNPGHLYAGDAKQNMKDKVERGRHHNSKVTHCPRGHEYSEDNTYYDKNNLRSCISCRDISNQKRYMPTLNIGTRTSCQTIPP